MRVPFGDRITSLPTSEPGEVRPAQFDVAPRPPNSAAGASRPLTETRSNHSSADSDATQDEPDESLKRTWPSSAGRSCAGDWSSLWNRAFLELWNCTDPFGRVMRTVSATPLVAHTRSLRPLSRDASARTIGSIRGSNESPRLSASDPIVYPSGDPVDFRRRARRGISGAPATARHRRTYRSPASARAARESIRAAEGVSAA